MLFITNYTPKSGINSEKRITGDPNFEIDLADNDPGISTYFCEKKSENNYEEIGHIKFFNKIKESNVKTILVYIHGYHNSPEFAFETSLLLQKSFDNRMKNEVLVIPFIWPCSTNPGFLRDYNIDRKTSAISGIALTRTIEFLFEWIKDNQMKNIAPCMKRISVLAHSMGNRVYEFALNELEESFSNSPVFIKNSFLVAADISYKTLEEDGRGKMISDRSKNVVIYYAKDDRALKVSPIMGLKNQRMGLKGPREKSLCDDNVYNIDCNRINDKKDQILSHFYLNDDDFLNHVFNSIKTGKINADEKRELKL